MTGHVEGLERLKKRKSPRASIARNCLLVAKVGDVVQFDGHLVKLHS